MGLEPRVQLDVAGRYENFLVNTGATYSVLIYSAAFSSQTCTILGATGKALQLYVHEREGIALGVLTQRLRSEPQPVAYLSKRLDPTAQGWPPCLRNLAAIAIMIEDALKLSFGGKLTIFTSHQVKQLLNGSCGCLIKEFSDIK